MLAPLRRTNRKAVSVMKELPAPVKGWNARDSIAEMKKDEAIILDNMFPEAHEVVLRDGSVDHVTGGEKPVHSLMAYHGPGGVNKLFAGSDGEIVDVTTADDAWPDAEENGFSNVQFSHVQVATSTGGHYLIVCNGEDAPFRYDGSTWEEMDDTILTGSADQEEFAHVNHWKQFVIFVEANSMDAWYLPVGTVGGGESVFPVGGLFKKGGYLMATATWTLDAGQGVDDHLVFVTSKGEVAVYRGTDLSDATKIALVGVWELAPPIGRRCFIKTGGDLVLLTTDGFLPLSKALLGDRLKPELALSDRIRTPLAEAVRLYGANFGWQAVFYPHAPALVFNIPLISAETSVLSHQYVMNTVTGAWCRFKGWDSYCWEVYNDALYYGGLGCVRKAWTGRSDLGSNIVGEAKQAFTDFGRPGEKHFKLARPTLQTDGAPGILIGMNVNYQDSAPMGVLSPRQASGGVWGTMVWGAGVWGGGLSTSRQWQSLSEVGTVGSFRMKVATKVDRVRWSATDVVFEPGGII